MELIRQVMDKGIVDRDGYKSGKVDDLVLELRGGHPPVVRGIVTQNGSLVRLLGHRLDRIMSALRGRLLGRDAPPRVIAWDHVTSIDVVVHTDVSRDAAGLVDTEKAVWDRWIRHIPFANR